MANTTIDDAVRRFNVRSFVTSNLLTEIDFNAQLNSTITQFIQSTTIDYSRLIDIIRLVTQVDQPFTGKVLLRFPSLNAALNIQDTINETTGQVSPQVCEKNDSFMLY